MNSAPVMPLRTVYRNIDKMMNQSRGEYAYSIIDIDKAGAKDIADEIATKEGILKVRVIK